MGKKRITTQQGTELSKKSTSSKSGKKKLDAGILVIEATFNNTKVSLTDKTGNVYAWSSSGHMGFKGAKKGTPFAASKVGEFLAEKAELLGVKTVDVKIKGVGSGREPAVRAFMARGIEVNTIKDLTPVPHNGPRAKKARRV